MKDKKYTCPCCGYKVFSGPPGTDEICTICFWHDDVSQLRFPYEGGANIPLVEAQKNFSEFGAKEKSFLDKVRRPGQSDLKDKDWFPLKNDTDIERLGVGKEYGATYPLDLTQLYYWGDNFWRK